MSDQARSVRLSSMLVGNYATFAYRCLVVVGLAIIGFGRMNVDVREMPYVDVRSVAGVTVDYVPPVRVASIPEVTVSQLPAVDVAWLPHVTVRQLPPVELSDEAAVHIASGVELLQDPLNPIRVTVENPSFKPVHVAVENQAFAPVEVKVVE